MVNLLPGPKQCIPSIADEFADVDLGDKRRNNRLRTIAEALCAAPDESFPEQARDSAELEATYRFLNNDAVGHEAILDAHVQQTRHRVLNAGLALVVHDTTEFAFYGELERDGLGALGGPKDCGGRKGFFFHPALALDGNRTPLGVLGAIPWVRKPKKKGKRSGEDYHANKEARRWPELVKRTQDLVAGRAELIHIMDREADNYELLAELIAMNARFVVRGHWDRKTNESVDGEAVCLSEVVARADELLTIEIPLSRRKKGTGTHGTRSRRPARDRRMATVVVKATQVVLKKPHRVPLYVTDAREITVNVVSVREVDPPKDDEPVEWLLLTSEPVDTAEAVQRVINYYKARWTIEEFFRALKSGCSFEARQLETYDALLRALMIFLPVAWQMLLLRSVARATPHAPAPEVLSPVQITVLRALAEDRGRKPLRDNATARDALLEVARLGGHIKNNGDPGWIVLRRGVERLDAYVAGWELARAAVGSKK